MDPVTTIAERLGRYRPFRPDLELARLREDERRMLPYLVRAAEAMDIPAWFQEYGNPEPLFAIASGDEHQLLLKANLGPWDRMRVNESFIPGIGPKPPGANYYPPDVTKEEFAVAASGDPALLSPYTMVRRDEGGRLVAIPYHQFFRPNVERAAESLNAAADLAASEKMKRYLRRRAEALLSDEYQASDHAWMEERDNTLDILIGPMEIEDRLFGIKTTYSAAILIRDWEVSAALSNFAGRLPSFQRRLPVSEVYKRERPGLGADLQVYDVFQFSGLDAVATPVGIAWPADEQIQREVGVRSMLLANVMRAKFDLILKRWAVMLVDPVQEAHFSFDAHFQRVMFHELAHGMGIKLTLADRKPVRETLGPLHHQFEEAKAELVGQHIAIQLNRSGELSDQELHSIYVSSLVSTLYNCDGDHSLMRLNYFLQSGAYSHDPQSGTYRVNPDQMPMAVEDLIEVVLRIQGDGDHRGAQELLDEYASPDESLTSALEKVDRAGTPHGLLYEPSHTEGGVDDQRWIE